MVLVVVVEGLQQRHARAISVAASRAKIRLGDTATQHGGMCRVGVVRNKVGVARVVALSEVKRTDVRVSFRGWPRGKRSGLPSQRQGRQGRGMR
jgi:hypothetical protein